MYILGDFSLYAIWGGQELTLHYIYFERSDEAFLVMYILGDFSLYAIWGGQELTLHYIYFERSDEAF